MLKQKIKNKEAGILLYGLTPPKQQNTADRIEEIALSHINRISRLTIDGLILYDIQDESQRTDISRPFPFLPTLDPIHYSDNYLKALDIPKIIYQCVGKHNESSLTDWLEKTNLKDFYSVFVGASSQKQSTSLNMNKAYQLRKVLNPDMMLGGVAIPERHQRKKDEHLRMNDKVINGCHYFISQAVYNVEASKNMLSDYYYHSLENSLDMVPIIITITPCGSLKTLQFLEWLGISIPKWLENELKYSGDILSKSVELCKDTFSELLEFSKEKNIPLGCNIESVAIRKEEIEASIELVNDISKMLKR